LVSIWNPWLAVLPFLFFVLCCWALAVGELWYLVGSVVVGSFLIQTHLGYAPVVGTLVFVGLVTYLFDTRRWWVGAGAVERGQRWRKLRRVGSVAVFSGVVIWLPPVIEQLTHEPGNLGETVAYFGEGTADTVPLADAAGVMALELGGYPPWAGGSEPTNALGVVPSRTLWSVLPVVVVSLAGAVAVWRRARATAVRPLRLQLLTWIGLVVGLVAITRIDRAVQVHLVRWLWPLAMLAWVSALWSLWTAVRVAPTLHAGAADVSDPHDQATRAVTAGVVGLAVVVSVVTSLAAFDRLVPSGQWSDQTAAVVNGVDEFVGGASVSVEVADGRLASLAVVSGLELALEARGADVRVPPEGDVRYGNRTSWAAAPPEQALFVATGDGVEELREDDRLVLVASARGDGSSDGSEAVAVFVRVEPDR
jgi:hypothetical protein